jgi:hypothetical protein
MDSKAESIGKPQSEVNHAGHRMFRCNVVARLGYFGGMRGWILSFGCSLGVLCLGHASPPEITARQPCSVFTLDHPPEIVLSWKGTEEFHGFIRVDRYDLLADATTSDYLPVQVRAGQPGTVSYKPILPFGVYRIDCTPVENRGPAAIPVSLRTTFAYAPARDPHQLPDDWPLGAHVTVDDPPLPGFKWYRYFSSWAEDNPAKGQFDWSRFDKVFGEVRDIGGKLLIANDTTPSWTAPGRPVTRPWVKSATAFPPDDMNDLRIYLDAMLRRYDDKAGTIGALEVWNEANTPDRWQGTPAQMVEMARIFREAAASSAQRVQREKPARIVGIAVSSGDAQDYVQGVIKAGILPYLDVVSGHWYEEMLSYDRATPINSLPLHVDLLAKPMRDAGYALPIWNSESGIGSVPRENGRLVSQDELNQRAESLPTFDAKQPWLLDGTRWRDLSERRAAASFVAGTAMLMSLGVEKTFVYTMRDEGWIQDGAPSLSWAALAEFGAQIADVDFHRVVPVNAVPEKSDPGARVLAFRFGAPDRDGVIVAWAYRLDTTVGRPKLWQPWLPALAVRLTIHTPEVEISDLYGRDSKRVSVPDDSLVIPIGEEPVYVRELRSGGR